MMHPPFRSRRAGGFTIVEVLVVISIITLLIGLLIPTLARARRAAWAASAQANIRQLQISHLSYTNDNRAQVIPGYRVPDGDRWSGRRATLWVSVVGVVRRPRPRLLHPPEPRRPATVGDYGRGV